MQIYAIDDVAIHSTFGEGETSLIQLSFSKNAEGMVTKWSRIRDSFTHVD